MKQSLVRILTGSLIVLIGLGALLDALGLVPFWSTIGNFWPIGLVIAGILVFLNNSRQVVWSSLLVVGGVLLQLRSLDVIDFNVLSLFWPIIILAIGFSILRNRTVTNDKARIQDTDTVSAILGGSDTINTSKDYKGGKATAVLGGVTLDLRDAVIKKEARLEVFALCGGIELKVPRDWVVRSEVFPILGGVDAKSQRDTEKANGPVLIITGTVALGGVDVKS